MKNLMKNNIDLTKVDNIVISGIDHNDYPDYVDAYIESADYNGIEMTEDQLEELSNDSEFVYDQLMKKLY